MAKFDEIEQITTKEMEKKVHIQAEAVKKKKAITPEEKRKFIAYGIIGIIALGFVFYAVNDFSGEDAKVVQELETPESEADKYNTKLQAIENGEKPVTTTANLEDAYKTSAIDQEKDKNDEAAKKLALQLKAMEDEENNPKPKPTPTVQNTVANNSSNSSTPVRRSSGNNTSRSTAVKPQYSTSTPSKTYNTSSQSSIAPSQTAEQTEEQELLRRKQLFENGTSTTKNNGKILAYIRGTQEIKNGQTIKFVTDKDFMASGVLIPKNTLVYGTIQYQESRIKVLINSINVNNTIVDTQISVYSTDGIEGLPVNSDQILKDSKNAAVEEASTQAGGYLGTAGRLLGGLVSAKSKETKVRFINNQKVIFVLKQ